MEQQISEQIKDCIEKCHYHSANLRLALIKEDRTWKIATARIILDISDPQESKILLDENSCRLVDFSLQIYELYGLLDYLKKVHPTNIRPPQESENIPDEMLFKIDEYELCVVGNFLDTKLSFYGRETAREYHGIDKPIYFADYAIYPTVAAKTHHQVDLSGHEIPLRNFTEALNHYWGTHFEQHNVPRGVNMYMPVFDASISRFKVKDNKLIIGYDVDTKRVKTEELSLGVIANGYNDNEDHHKRYRIAGDTIEIDIGFVPRYATITLNKNSDKLDVYDYYQVTTADFLPNVMNDTIIPKSESPMTASQVVLEQSRVDEIKEKLNEIIELINRKDVRIEAFLSLILEKQSLTQDKFDELMKLLKDYGRKRGLYRDKE